MGRWWRYVGFFLIGASLGAAGAFLYHWVRLRGFKTEAPFVQPSSVVPSTTPQEMRLWPGKAPGSENWKQQEIEAYVDGEHRLYNVVDPTLTAYFPPPGTADGTAVIVCPGGALYLLSVDSEGVKVARFLNSLGVTAFVLHYRLAESNSGTFPSTTHNVLVSGSEQGVIDKMTPLITADGQQAVRIVRSHAAQWGLDPRRIGVIGFSSGGYLVLRLAVLHDPDSMPDFAVPIYPVPSIILNAKPDPIPMFIACADSDSAANCAQTYDWWRNSGTPAELHVFVKGGHGFGMTKQNLPSDIWPELFAHWLQAQGFLPSPSGK